MLLYHTYPFAQSIDPSIATIGNFDGMHKGHINLLNDLKQLAKEHALKSTIIIFEPQPLEYLSPDKKPFRLQSFREKFIICRELNIDQMICLRFDDNLANLSPTIFIEEILKKHCQIKGLMIGEDFCFGRNRTGNVKFLQEYANSGNFILKIMPTVYDENKRISSTAIRLALQQADFLTAADLLQRPYTISGKVVHGHKKGRILGFPTANISLRSRHTKINGVYGVRVNFSEKNQSWLGIANLGSRPTIDDEKIKILEVFLFNAENLDLYGKRLEVEFLIKIRDEKKFTDLSSLKTQINKDIEFLQQWFDEKCIRN